MPVKPHDDTAVVGNQAATQNTATKTRCNSYIVYIYIYTWYKVVVVVVVVVVVAVVVVVVIIPHRHNASMQSVVARQAPITLDWKKYLGSETEASYTRYQVFE